MGKRSRSKIRDKDQAGEKRAFDSAERSAEPGEVSNTGRFVLQSAFACLLAYAVCLTFRLLEIPAWNSSAFKFGGEYLMATHDAYAWLAGAEGVNRKTGSGFSRMLAFMHQLTGFDPANIGFWVPALMAPLVVLPLALLSWLKRQPEAGAVSGVMAAGCLGFLLRTRVGFADTDVLALFFPVAIACGLLIWLSSICRGNWRKGKNEEAPPSASLFLFLSGAVGIGLLVQGYGFFYGKIQVALALIGFAFILGMFFASRSVYPRFILGFAALVASSFGGWPGLALGAVVCAAAKYKARIFENWSVIAVFAALTLVFAGGDMLNLFLGAFSKLLGYAKVSTAEFSDNSSLKLPAIAQSVREAQNVNWGAMISRTSGGWWIFWPAFAGYVYLVWKRPLFLIFLPLLGLGIASVKLGNRFAMFGGAGLGVGLGFGLNRLLLDLNQPRLRRWLVQIALCALVSLPLWNVADSLRPSPILPPVYAKTLQQVGEKVPENAQLWQWWDYGYAAQYYAGKRVFGDGGQHGGEYLYPLARVHSTDSPLQAAQLMKFTLKTQLKQFREMEKNGTLAPIRGKAQNYPGDPVKPLREMGADEAKEFVASMKLEKMPWPEDLPEQYLVLSWENMRLSYWISFYGTWDLVTGKSFPGRLQRVTSETRLNSEKGVLQFRQGNAIPLTSMDYLAPDGRQHKNWSNSGNIHAVFNAPTKELFLMDDTIYNSMMVKMLIGDPDNFNDHFELVVDNFPYNRAYRVK